MGELFCNAGRYKLQEALTDAASQIVLDSTLGLPVMSSGDLLRMVLDDGTNIEIVTATGRSGGTLTGVVRGIEGTVAQAWPAGAIIGNRWTAELARQALEPVPAQAPVDWTATSGPSAILNKPTLGSAAAQSANAFATADQGTLADSAIQQVKTLNGQSLAGPGNIVLPPGQTRKFRRFTASGTFVPTAAHLAAGGFVDYLIAGGGGGGGAVGNASFTGGGGGGGGLRRGSLQLTGPVNITIGGGGRGGSSSPGTGIDRSGLNGGQSAIGGLVSVPGGGGGGGQQSGINYPAKPGACGGGDAHSGNNAGAGGGMHAPATYLNSSATGRGSIGGDGSINASTGGVGIDGLCRGGDAGRNNVSQRVPEPNSGEGGGGGTGTPALDGVTGIAGVVEFTWFE